MPDKSDNIPGDAESLLSDGQQLRCHKRSGLWLAIAVVLIVVVFITVYIISGKDSSPRFRTADVEQGALTITVTATGKLEPVNQVEVGTEVSGTIESVYVDYNDQVKAGQVLARLETDQLQARLRQSQAALELARAHVRESEATVVEMRNKFLRSKELAKKGLCSKEVCDEAEASYKRARAALTSARAQVTQASAQLDADQTALDKAVIHSPINGIVLQRNVEPGQTVAASFQAPILFVLAEDLARMQLHADIDEADVGQVKVDQPANFTVDAYPQRHFSARILKVYYAPQVVQDVVTYKALLSVDNSELLLRPGMTATADIVIKEVKNAILVPNAALRFTPPQTKPEKTSVLRTLLPGPPRRQQEKQRKIILSEKTQQQVWILQDGVPVAIPVTIGATNGRMTEILAGDIKPGMSLLVDVVRASK